MLTFVPEGRGASSNVLLHPYLPDVRSWAHLTSLLLLLQLVLLHRRVGTLQWSLPFAVTHLQLLTTGLCPGTQQLTYILRLATNSLVALKSVSV
jgi:hypothetical protein